MIDLIIIDENERLLKKNNLFARSSRYIYIFF